MDRSKLLEAGANLLSEHSLHTWAVELRAKTGGRLGECHYKYRLVVLNDYYVDNNSDEAVVEILRHEVAHALTPGHKHDAVWRAMALKLGCKLDNDCKIMVQPGKYKAVCPTCEAVFYKYRKPKYVEGYYCPKCGKEHGKLAFHTGETWGSPVV
jgi:predicted SprT family Zn-dependent metalloprotease